jgi:hypothetical protein
VSFPALSWPRFAALVATFSGAAAACTPANVASADCTDTVTVPVYASPCAQAASDASSVCDGVVLDSGSGSDRAGDAGVAPPDDYVAAWLALDCSEVCALVDHPLSGTDSSFVRCTPPHVIGGFYKVSCTYSVAPGECFGSELEETSDGGAES